ncbi:hypothetical protein CAF53_26055, partial [Sphingobium sp. LB126]|uniref:DUF6118 family protein n=1 Tax=Sphingobium sp. LB126 TaxID=1983755 RepID=UPI000CC15F81
ALGEKSAWDAGQRLMQTAAPESWGLIVAAAPLADGNREAVQACRKQAEKRGDYTKVTYLHAKGEQIRYDASRCYSQAFLPLLCGAALRAPIWEGGNPIDQRSR